jgi:hypothetical protein
MHLIKYNSWQILNSYMFLTEVPSSGFFYNKGIQIQHPNLGSASPLFEWLKY